MLSALADGEAGAEELAALRPQPQDLPELPGAPAQVPRRADPRGRARPAALVAAGAGGDGPGALRSLVESIVGATHDKAVALGERAHAAAELATGTEARRRRRPAAALAVRGEDPQPARERPAQVEPVNEELPSSAPAEPTASERPPPAPASPAAPQPEPPPPDPASEFGPGPTAAAAPAPSPAPSGRFAPGGASAGGNTGGDEFGP